MDHDARAAPASSSEWLSLLPLVDSYQPDTVQAARAPAFVAQGRSTPLPVQDRVGGLPRNAVRGMGGEGGVGGGWVQEEWGGGWGEVEGRGMGG